MERVLVTEGSKYKYYFYQTSTSFCNTTHTPTPLPLHDLPPAITNAAAVLIVQSSTSHPVLLLGLEPVTEAPQPIES
jgi:hypothetical protein